MSGEIENASRRRAERSYSEPEPSASQATSAVPPKPTTGGGAPSGWNADYDKIPAGIRAYDEQLFKNPALISAWPAAPTTTKKTTSCSVKIPDPPPPLPPGPIKTAPNAYRGIQLMILEEDLAPARTVLDRTMRAGDYRLHPHVTRQPDGTEACVYWTAHNTKTKRTEYVVGPNDLQKFIDAAPHYEMAAGVGYLGGAPNKWTLESMKAGDSALRCGPFDPKTVGHLKKAWLEAAKDPEWWMSVAASSGDIANPRVPAYPPKSELGSHTPITPGGGLMAHELKRGHCLAKHVGKTDAEMIARANAPGGPKEGVSSFPDRVMAERAAVVTLNANEQMVTQWIESGATGKLQIEFHAAESVGSFVAKGDTVVRPVKGTRLVLLPDATTGCGFRILTGFPIPQ